MATALFLLPLAYLLGAFPTAALMARARGHDVLHEGSGNPGASNVSRLMGWKAGLVVLLADVAKGAVPAAVGLALDGHRGAYILGIAALVGHLLPVTQRFRGGRGVATAGGMLAVIFPLIALGLAVLWFLLARVIVRKASIASIVVTVAFPTLVGLTGNSWGDVAVTSALAVLILVRHLPNLRRLLRGQELGLDQGSAGGGGSA